MGIHEDRERYRRAIYQTPFDIDVRTIAREVDRLAGVGTGNGKMFEMQVASILHAARSVGYELKSIDGRKLPAPSGLDQP